MPRFRNLGEVNYTSDADAVVSVAETGIGDGTLRTGSTLIDRARSPATIGFLKSVLRGALRVLLFPWLIWTVVAIMPRALRRRLAPRAGMGRYLILALHTALYCTVGLPATVFVAGEVLISANEWLIGEQADYRLQSDFQLGLEHASVTVPGPTSHTPPPVEAGATEAHRSYLVQLYSPVIVHKLAHHPEWDIPLALDFDGNRDPRDNVINEPRHRPHTAGVYGELTAETEDSYYLLYSLYHIKDYDHPLREALTDWTFHDNDNEGFMVRVDKRSMEVVQIEAWFHNRFLLYSRTDRSQGTEPIHGMIHLENGTHPIIYAQPQGHGVRVFQALDLDALDENVKIMRYRGDRPVVHARADRSFQVDVTYELLDFDWWYAAALGPLGSRGQGTGVFEEPIPIGVWPDGREIEIGRFIAGYDYSKFGWSRPKPPWSWDDGWDEIPIWVWHFLPSYAFESHSGVRLSHEYLFNRPVEKTFDMRADELVPHLRLEIVYRSGDKWGNLEDRGGNLEHRSYWQALEMVAKRYVNYLFHALG